MRRLSLVVLASALTLAATDFAQADSLQLAPKKTQKYQRPNVIEGHGKNTLTATGTDNRYFSDSLNFRENQGPAYLRAVGGWQTLPCGTDVFGCF